MLALENIDKSLATFAIRIPQITKKGLDNLPSTEKAALRGKILELMARAIHNSPAHYDANVYLSEKPVKTNDAQPEETAFSLETEE